MFKHGKIYGYEYKGVMYRYFSSPSWKINDGYFRIIFYKPIILYAQNDRTVTGSYEERYYYSLSLNSEIKPLTYTNIEQDFINRSDILMKLHELKSKNIKAEARTDQGDFLILNIFN